MITCKITSSSENKVYDNLKSILIPISSGNMEILTGHAESFILVSEGNIVLRFFDVNNNKIIIKSKNGECHIKNNKVVIIF